METKLTEETRVESDLIGAREIPASALYGVQTLRGIENFPISKFHLNEYPLFINGLAITKMAAAMANYELGLLTKEQKDAIVLACQEILNGEHHEQFPVDMIQGGAGTSTNMNANEVIANRALEIMGHKRGEYQYCSPNDHVNCSQSTNDAYNHPDFEPHQAEDTRSRDKRHVMFPKPNHRPMHSGVCRHQNSDRQSSCLSASAKPLSICQFFWDPLST